MKVPSARSIQIVSIRSRLNGIGPFNNITSDHPEMVDFVTGHLCGVAFRRRRKARAFLQPMTQPSLRLQAQHAIPRTCPPLAGCKKARNSALGQKMPFPDGQQGTYCILRAKTNNILQFLLYKMPVISRCYKRKITIVALLVSRLNPKQNNAKSKIIKHRGRLVDRKKSEGFYSGKVQIIWVQGSRFWVQGQRSDINIDGFVKS